MFDGKDFFYLILTGFFAILVTQTATASCMQYFIKDECCAHAGDEGCGWDGCCLDFMYGYGCEEEDCSSYFDMMSCEMAGCQWCGDTMLCNHSDNSSTLSCNYTLPENSSSTNTAYMAVCQETLCSGTKTVPYSANHPPTLLFPPYITPDTVYASSQPRCIAGVFYDQDGDSEGAHHWNWFIDGALDELDNSSTLSAADFVKHQQLACRQTPVDDNNLAGAANNASFVIVLNSPPTLPEIPSQTACVGTAFTLQVTAVDDDLDELLYGDDTFLFEIDEESGLISFTPQAGDEGAYLVTLTASDDDDTSQTSFTINISSTITQENQVHAGWNLISLPLTSS